MACHIFMHLMKVDLKTICTISKLVQLTSDNVVLKDTSKSFFSFMSKPVRPGSKCTSSQVTCDINTSAVASPAWSVVFQ